MRNAALLAWGFVLLALGVVALVVGSVVLEEDTLALVASLAGASLVAVGVLLLSRAGFFGPVWRPPSQ